MKRHDVSNPGPDTRYPANNGDVILWRKSGQWTKGFFIKEYGFGASSGGWLPLDDVVAWSDPTEPESAEPTGWQPIETAPKDFVTEFDGWNGERVPNVIWAHPEGAPKGTYCWCVSEYVQHHGWILEEVKGLTHWMPLPPAPGESPATTVDHSALLRMAGEALQKARTYKDALIAGEWEEIDDIIAAIRAATGGV